MEAAAAELTSLIGPKLLGVEAEFRSWLGSDVEVLDRANAYLAEQGGKRLRPALLLLASGLVEYDGPHDVLFGAAFEFIHNATLVHDDIIDGSEIRRGRPSLNQTRGSGISVLVGDHLYLTAMKMALRARNLRVLDLIADTTLAMTEGELLQKHVNGRIDVTEEQALEIVRRKTARLFSACCRVPAMLADAGPEREADLGGYGEDLGMAFQIADDVLDLTADEKVLGKPVGGDLRNGKVTLPLIRLMRQGGERHRDLVAGILGDGGFGARRRAEIVQALTDSGVLEQTLETARTHARRAAARLEAFPESPYRHALARAAEFVVSRNR